MDFASIGHAFRGLYLDKCGVIERWATTILNDPRSEQRRVGQSPYLFGEKLKAVRSLAQRDSAAPPDGRILRKPSRVIALLDQFQPYAELRANLAHSIQQVALATDGTPVFLYKPVSCDRDWKTVALPVAAQENISRWVASLAHQFDQQGVR